MQQHAAACSSNHIRAVDVAHSVAVDAAPLHIYLLRSIYAYVAFAILLLPTLACAVTMCSYCCQSCCHRHCCHYRHCCLLLHCSRADTAAEATAVAAAAAAAASSATGQRHFVYHMKMSCCCSCSLAVAALAISRVFADAISDDLAIAGCSCFLSCCCYCRYSC